MIVSILIRVAIARCCRQGSRDGDHHHNFSALNNDLVNLMCRDNGFVTMLVDLKGRRVEHSQFGFYVYQISRV